MRFCLSFSALYSFLALSLPFFRLASLAFSGVRGLIVLMGLIPNS